MNEMITRIEENGQTDKQARDSYVEEYQTMMGNHKNHSINADNLDKTFALGMSMHHQMAIDMAETIVKYTTAEEMLSFAKQINFV